MRHRLGFHLGYAYTAVKDQVTALARGLGTYGLFIATAVAIYADYRMDQRIRKQLQVTLFLRRNLSKIDILLGQGDKK